MLDNLKALLSLDEIASEVLNPHPSDQGDLRDFCDGSVFNSHSLFSTCPDALQIIGYYDELEVVNPIGSYVSKHKLGCLFFFLANIRPQYRSTLKAINLLAVGKHEDISHYGIDVFLSPFVEDLKTLYCDGITVTLNDSAEHTFYGGLLAFLADNLAAHAVAGFKESMSFSLRICRTCMVTLQSSQEVLTEENCQLRSPEAHFHQCQLLNGELCSHYSTTYGINRLSVLEEVPEFSVASGIPHDIMHDLFEGVVPYELKRLLLHCIQKKYFTLDTLNDRIERFDFVSNKPSRLDKDSSKKNSIKIRQSASQMIELSFHLPLIIADKVPDDDKNWQSFLLLLKICRIALSPVCTYDTAAYFKLIVEEKLVVFKELYPDSRLIPKFHYMIHYAAQMLKFGPLINCWTMRQESKLSFVKKASRRGNFKNVPQTVARKHQLWQCYKLQTEKPFLHVMCELSPRTTSCTLDVEAQILVNEVLRVFPTISHDALVVHPNWVKLQSSKYYKGVYLLLKYDRLSAEFGKIVDIAFISDSVFLHMHVYTSDYFDEHYNAFVISSTSMYIVKLLDHIPYHRPLHVKQTFLSSDDKLYIIPPFYF